MLTPTLSLSMVVAAAAAAAPKLVVTLGIVGGVSTASFSDDGALLITGNGDDTAVIWDVETGNEVRRFRHGETVIFARMTPAAAGPIHVVTCGSSHCTLWDAADDAHELARIPAKVGSMGHGAPHGAPFALSPDGKSLWVASDAPHLWSTSTGTAAAAAAAATCDVGEVGNAAFASDSRRLALSGDGGVCVVDVATGKQAWKVAGTDESRDDGPLAWRGNELLTSSLGTLRLRNGDTGAVTAEWPASSGVGIFALAASNDGAYALSAAFQEPATLWRLPPPPKPPLSSPKPSSSSSAQVVRRIAFGNTVGALAFSPDGKRIVGGDWSGDVRIMDAANENAPPVPLRSSLTTARALAFVDDAPRIVTAARDGRGFAWDPAAGRVTALAGHGAEIIDASINGDVVATGADDHSLSVWNAESGLETMRMEGHAQPVGGVSLGAHVVATASGAVQLWDVATGARVAENNDAMIGFWRVALAPDEKTIVADELTANNVVGIDAKKGATRFRVKSADAALFAFSHDSTTVAIVDERGAPAWISASNGKPSPSSKKLAAALAMPNGVSVGGLAFSDDGAVFAVGGSDGVLRTVAVTAKAVAPGASVSLGAPISRVALSSDGKRALADSGSTIALVDVAKARVLCRLALFDDGHFIAAAPDGRFDADRLEDLRGVSWILPDKPLKPLSPELFMRDYFEPGLVRRLLADEELPAVRDLAALDLARPVVSFVDVAVAATAAAANNNVRVVVATSGAHAREVRLFRDGHLVGRGAPDGAGRVAFPAVSLRHDGRAELMAYAFNDSGVRSAIVRRSIAPPKPPKPPDGAASGRAYVVTIGVDQFADPSLALHYAAADAVAVGASLTKSLAASKAWQSVVPVALVDGDAKTTAATPTRDNIVDVLRVLGGAGGAGGGGGGGGVDVRKRVRGADELRAATPDDLVVIAVSTHGARKDGVFYVAPSGADRNLATWLSSDDLTGLFEKIDAGEIVVVIDACHSAAAVDGGGDFKPGPFGGRSLGQLAYDKRMRVLAASQADAPAMESASIGHGFLSFALTSEALDGARADRVPRDDAVTVGEWLAFGRARVPKLAADIDAGVDVTANVARDVLPAVVGVKRRAVPRSQAPVLYDFGTGGTGGASGGDVDTLLQASALRAHEEPAATVDDALADKDPAKRLARLRRYLRDHPVDADVDARLLLLDALIEVGGDAHEIVVECRRALAPLRRRGEEESIRYDMLLRVADSLATRKLALDDARSLALQARAMLMSRGAGAQPLADVDAIVKRIDAANAKRP